MSVYILSKGRKLNNNNNKRKKIKVKPEVALGFAGQSAGCKVRASADFLEQWPPSSAGLDYSGCTPKDQDLNGEKKSQQP